MTFVTFSTAVLPPIILVGLVGLLVYTLFFIEEE